MLLSVVIPVYNEVEALPHLLNSLREVLDSISADHELVFVDDGSTDGSLALLLDLASRDSRIKVLKFSRNFGHQMAITAGLDFASGDATVVMDADLQDPPELLPEMIELYRNGYDVVSAQRSERDTDSVFKRATANAFYTVMRHCVDKRLVDQVGDFRLFSARAVTAIRGFREQHKFMRGLVAWLGLKEVIIPFRRQNRVAGTTKYPTWKMVRFAWTAITSFSALPLRLTLVGGLAITLFGVVYTGYVLYVNFVTRQTVPGWSSLVCLQVIFSGAVLSALGLIGDYIARIYEESKMRPLYVISEVANGGQVRSVPRGVVLPQSPSGHMEQVLPISVNAREA